MIRTEALESLTKEFDLEKSQSRYASVNPELIKLCESLGLSDEKKDASRALFVADYIFTESPAGSSEEDRRKDVVKMFLIGIDRIGEKGSDILVQAFHLAYKTGSMIKRSDIFMAGRGIPRETSLLILKDIFVDAYLKVSSDLLGPGKCGFELALLAGALTKTFPSVEYESYKEAPKATDYVKLLSFTWKLLQGYNAKVKVEVNDQVVIPNIDRTSSVLSVSSDNFSSYNVATLPANLKDNRAILKEVDDFISQADSTRPLVYFRGKILKTNEKFFLIRNPNSPSKPFLLLRSTADEVNVTEILTLLRHRGRELVENASLFKPVPKPTPQPVKTEEKKTKEAIKPVEQPPVTPKPQTASVEEPKKPGFFARLFGRGKKKDQSASSASKAVSGEVKPVDKKPETKKEKVVKHADPSTSFADYISFALSLIAVGDLQLFEIFDTFRESNYQFLGVLHSDFTKNTSTFKAHKKFSDARGLVNTLNGLDVVLEKALKHFYGQSVQIMPEEILFTSTSEARYVMLFEGNDEHLVGMAGTTSIDEDYTGKEPETFQRRTLGMRTNQILNSLKSNRFSDAIVRVLSDEIVKNTNDIEYDVAVLNIHQ